MRRALSLPLLLITFLLVSVGCAGGLTIMSWNVENLFDDVDDGSEFPEFDPGRGRWNAESFALRVDALAEAIRKVVPGGPDLLVLQEVENGRALEALAGQALADFHYRDLVIVPKRQLPANVAFASRWPVRRVSTWQVSNYRDNVMRDVLEVEVAIDGRPLHVLVNHWKSKTGGERQTEPWRLEAAARILARVRELLVADPGADIVVAGDLNEEVDEWDRAGRAYQTALVPLADRPPEAFLGASLLLAGRSSEAGLRGAGLALYEPWYEVPYADRGSYVYQGRWETLDHLLLSPGLFDDRGLRYRMGSFRAVRLPFLLGADGAPKRWEGFGAGGGFSDHLPLVLTLDALN